ncbi:MAG: hypothetical protein SF052_24110 [Bacteroidia bacterium]|nr:hypothetical protein [Bacteroidia bacterium]
MKTTMFFATATIVAACILCYWSLNAFTPVSEHVVSVEWPFFEGQIGEIQSGGPVITCNEADLLEAYKEYLSTVGHGGSGLDDLDIIFVNNVYYIHGEYNGFETICALKNVGGGLLLDSSTGRTVTCSGCGTCGIDLQKAELPCLTCSEPPTCGRSESIQL